MNWELMGTGQGLLPFQDIDECSRGYEIAARMPLNSDDVIISGVYDVDTVV